MCGPYIIAKCEHLKKISGIYTDNQNKPAQLVSVLTKKSDGYLQVCGECAKMLEVKEKD